MPVMLPVITSGTAVIIGAAGEVGDALYRLCLSACKRTIGIDTRFRFPPEYPPTAPVVMHVALPGALPKFCDVVCEYAEKYEPRLVLVHSTTIPGTMAELVRRLGKDSVVHTQVHGKHSSGRMRSDMLRHLKFVATESDIAFGAAHLVLVAMGHPAAQIRRLHQPLAGELTKLLATSLYGYLIVWAQEMEALSSQCGVPYDELTAFLEIETSDFDIRSKVPGVIGGHCVTQNLELLQSAFPSPLWDVILQVNAEYING